MKAENSPYGSINSGIAALHDQILGRAPERNVEYHRRRAGRDLIHIRDEIQKTLRRDQHVRQ